MDKLENSVLGILTFQPGWRKYTLIIIFSVLALVGVVDGDAYTALVAALGIATGVEKIGGSKT